MAALILHTFALGGIKKVWDQEKEYNKRVTTDDTRKLFYDAMDNAEDPLEAMEMLNQSIYSDMADALRKGLDRLMVEYASKMDQEDLKKAKPELIYGLMGDAFHYGEEDKAILFYRTLSEEIRQARFIRLYTMDEKTLAWWNAEQLEILINELDPTFVNYIFVPKLLSDCEENLDKIEQVAQIIFDLKGEILRDKDGNVLDYVDMRLVEQTLEDKYDYDLYYGPRLGGDSGETIKVNSIVGHCQYNVTRRLDILFNYQGFDREKYGAQFDSIIERVAKIDDWVKQHDTKQTLDARLYGEEELRGKKEIPLDSARIVQTQDLFKWYATGIRRDDIIERLDQYLSGPKSPVEDESVIGSFLTAAKDDLSQLRYWRNAFGEQVVPDEKIAQLSRVINKVQEVYQMDGTPNW